MLKELKEYRRRRQTHVKVLRKVAMYTLITLGSLFSVFPALIVGTTYAQYIPDTERISLKIDDDRTTQSKIEHNYLKTSDEDDKTFYSALSYNLGFNAYNQDMHFFMDMDINQGNGQSWAESTEAINKSNAGVARVLSASHDSIYHSDYNDLSIPAQDLRGSTVYRTVYKTDDPYTVDNDELIGITQIDQFNDELNSVGDGTFDFIAFQEQDVDSTRSYYINEYQKLRSTGYSEDVTEIDPDRIVTDTLADHYSSTYAYNFSVPWIPYPLNQMHGQVQGGLSVSSKYTMKSTPERVTLPNITSFPLNLFELKRCLISTKYRTDSGKDFVFLNAHFSAYDDSGLVRLQQLGYVQNVFQQEIDKGNYVILAADWNQVLPQTYGYSGSDTMFDGEIIYDKNDLAISPWSFSDFKWGIADPTKPTDGSSFATYDKYVDGKSYSRGDVVKYDEHEVDGYIDHICKNYYDKDYPHQHLYTPLQDNTTEAPLIQEGGKWVKSKQWRYYDSKYYTNTSLSHRVLDKLLPVAGTDPEKNQAHFFTTHAIPTVRNAGYNYRSVIPGYVNQYGTSIDGFLISNNIGVNFTFGIDTQFAYSDHNPTGISFYLKK